MLGDVILPAFLEGGGEIRESLLSAFYNQLIQKIYEIAKVIPRSTVIVLDMSRPHRVSIDLTFRVEGRR